jgi:hypothetical protein
MWFWLCPSLCPVPVAEVMRRNPSTKFSDMTGARFGRIEVIGLAQFIGNGSSKWVVRCDCGRYEIRLWLNLRNMKRKGRESCCGHCAGALRKDDKFPTRYRTTGEWISA